MYEKEITYQGWMPRSHCSVFVQKGRKNIRFVKAFTLLHKNAQKRKFSQNNLQIRYLQKRRFLKTLWISVNVQKQTKNMLQQQQQNTSQISRQIQR